MIKVNWIIFIFCLPALIIPGTASAHDGNDDTKQAVGTSRGDENIAG